MRSERQGGGQQDACSPLEERHAAASSAGAPLPPSLEDASRDAGSSAGCGEGASSAGQEVGPGAGCCVADLPAAALGCVSEFAGQKRALVTAASDSRNASSPRACRAMTRRRFVGGLALAALSAATLPLVGCVDQHPYRNADGTEQQRLIATSPAVATICDKLDLDLVGVCSSSRDMPERYAQLPQVGSPMSPDLEVVKSLHPSCVIGPNSLIDDLRPKYAGIAVACMFLDLRSVEGMYASISAMGAKFDRREQAVALVAEYDAFMADYRASIEGKPQPSVLVLMGPARQLHCGHGEQLCRQPGGAGGGQNVYAGSDQEFLNVNTEDMQGARPRHHPTNGARAADQVMAMFADEFATNDVWKHFRAVKEGRVYDLPYDQFGMSATFNYPEALRTLQPCCTARGSACARIRWQSGCFAFCAGGLGQSRRPAAFALRDSLRRPWRPSERNAWRSACCWLAPKQAKRQASPRR